MSNVYVLYVFMLSVNAYSILPIADNPFSTFEECKTIRDYINKYRTIQIGPYKFAARSAQCRKEPVQ